jgi:hypothetical protein
MSLGESEPTTPPAPTSDPALTTKLTSEDIAKSLDIDVTYDQARQTIAKPESLKARAAATTVKEDADIDIEYLSRLPLIDLKERIDKTFARVAELKQLAQHHYILAQQHEIERRKCEVRIGAYVIAIRATLKSKQAFDEYVEKVLGYSDRHLDRFVKLHHNRDVIYHVISQIETAIESEVKPLFTQTKALALIDRRREKHDQTQLTLKQRARDAIKLVKIINQLEGMFTRMKRREVHNATIERLVKVVTDFAHKRDE